jgi:prophage tail gpP-like protein
VRPKRSVTAPWSQPPGRTRPWTVKLTMPVRVSGQSKFADLVFASGFTTQWNLSNLTLAGVANAICSPFGISVSTPNGDTASIPNLSVVVTETGWEFLEEACRWMIKLLYDDVNGNLVLADVGTLTHASGVGEGVNVERARSIFDLSEVPTSVAAIYQDVSILSDGGNSTTIEQVDKALATNGTFPARADGKPRYRPLLIVSEQGKNYAQVVERRVQWEMARRVGRSQVVTVVVDSWRDAAGDLWTPNWLIPVTLPSMKLTATSWLITNVTYTRDENGTHAELTLMPPAAMAPMPEASFLNDPALADASNYRPTGAQTSPTQAQL